MTQNISRHRPIIRKLQIFCKGCSKDHIKGRCQINCKYCHTTHYEKEMVRGLCPRLSHNSKELAKEQSYECPKCKGIGCYIKKEEIRIEETEEKYQQRLAEWKQQKQYNVQGEKKLQRKIILIKQKKNKITCKACDGGRVYRFNYCCMRGCDRCKNQGIIESKRWMHCRRLQKQKGLLQGRQIHQIPSICTICHSKLKYDENVYRLQCSHVFHRACIEPVIKNKSQCPFCGQQQPQFYVKKQEQPENSSSGSENQFDYQPLLEQLQTVSSDEDI